MNAVREIIIDNDRESLIIELNEEADFISTIPQIGERIKYIVIAKVDNKTYIYNLVEMQREILNSLGIDHGIVFLTAADVKKYIWKTIDIDEKLKVDIVATIGLEPPVCVGYNKVYKPIAGTINIIAIVNMKIPKSTLADLFKTVVEAKVSASTYLLLRCRSRSVGTVSDAIAVGSMESKYRANILSAGIATSIGSAVSREIYRAIIDRGIETLGLNGFIKNCTGLSVEELINLIDDSIGKIYRILYGGEVYRDRWVRAKYIAKKYIRDPNVLNILISARELEYYNEAGIPKAIVKAQGDLDLLATEMGYLVFRYICLSEGYNRSDDLFSIYHRILNELNIDTNSWFGKYVISGIAVGALYCS